MPKEHHPSGLDLDATAVVIDDHTGRVQAYFQGFGAKEDAERFKRGTQHGVKHLSSTSVVTGEKAKRAIKKGRI